MATDKLAALSHAICMKYYGSPEGVTDPLGVHREIVTAVSAELQATISALEADNKRLREAVAWYGSRAEALTRYMSAKPINTDPVESVITELTLDNGRHAREAQ